MARKWRLASSSNINILMAFIDGISTAVSMASVMAKRNNRSRDRNDGSPALTRGACAAVRLRLEGQWAMAEARIMPGPLAWEQMMVAVLTGFRRSSRRRDSGLPGEMEITISVASGENALEMRSMALANHRGCIGWRRRHSRLRLRSSIDPAMH